MKDLMEYIGIGIVTILVIAFLVFIILYGHKENDIAREFCPDGLVLGRGVINYCHGKPFVCNSDKQCYYSSSNLEDCWEEQQGKVIVTVCE